jgi:hypothetical protein
MKPQVTGIGVQLGWSPACRPPERGLARLGGSRSRSGRSPSRSDVHGACTSNWPGRQRLKSGTPSDEMSGRREILNAPIAESALNVAGGRASAKRHRIALFCAMVMQSAMTSGGGFGCVPSLCEFALPGRGVLDHDRPDPGLQRGCWRLAGALTFTPCRVVKLCGSHGNGVIAGG